MGAITWENANFNYESATYIWDLVQEIIDKKGGGLDVQALKKLDSKKKKKLVRLIMRRNGIKMYDESKEIKDITAYTKDIKLIIKEVLSSVKIKI